MRADAILPCKPFPPLEIERREAPKLALTSKFINDELRGIFRVAVSQTGSMPLKLGDGWVALGLVQSRARSTAGYAEFPRSPFFIPLKGLRPCPYEQHV
jgi:hypothetical protein